MQARPWNQLRIRTSLGLASATDIWVYGDGNSIAMLAALQTIAEPDWNLVDQTEGGPDGFYFPRMAKEDLAAASRPPDIVVVGYSAGAFAWLFCKLGNYSEGPAPFAQLTIDRILAGVELFKAQRSAIIMTRGAFTGSGLTSNAYFDCIDDTYQYIWEQTASQPLAPPHVDWRLPRDDAAMWENDRVHMSPAGAAKVAERVKVEIQRHD